MGMVLSEADDFFKRFQQDAVAELDRRLPWTETFDDDDNSIWEAPSAFLDGEDGAPFMWRLRQRLMNNFVFWTDDASDAELSDGPAEVYASLKEGRDACEFYNETIIHERSSEVVDEAL